jgi:hypothetical protein
MGFENRKEVRAKADFHFFYWLGYEATGPTFGAEAANLSMGGLGFWCGEGLPPGQTLMVEMSLPGQPGHVRLRAQVLRTEAPQAGRCLVHCQFTAMDGDTRLALRRYILQVSDPRLAAATGWGKAYFQDQRHFEVEYRELPAELARHWLEAREYLDAKGLIYLKGFQAFLEAQVGAPQPGAFKLLGTRSVKEKSALWLEVRLSEGPLLMLAETLWCTQDPGEKAVIGLVPRAYQKEMALRIEKGGRL